MKGSNRRKYRDCGERSRARITSRHGVRCKSVACGVHALHRLIKSILATEVHQDVVLPIPAVLACVGLSTRCQILHFQVLAQEESLDRPVSHALQVAGLVWIEGQQVARVGIIEKGKRS